MGPTPSLVIHVDSAQLIATLLMLVSLNVPASLATTELPLTIIMMTVQVSGNWSLLFHALLKSYFNALLMHVVHFSIASPSPPRDLIAHNITNTSMILSWHPPVEFGGRDPNEVVYTLTITRSGKKSCCCFKREKIIRYFVLIERRLVDTLF